MESEQKQIILKNMTELMLTTSYNNVFLTKFVSAGVLTLTEVSEIAELGSESKGYKFYQIILTRSDSFDVLLGALRDTKQTGSLKILESGIKKLEDIDLNNSSLTWDTGLVLGKGSQCVIFKGHWGGRAVAVRRVQPGITGKQMIHELQVMKLYDIHENILRFYTHQPIGRFIYIANELCDMSLEQWVTQKTHREKISLSPFEVLKQLTNGMEYLHNNNIVHRNLKPPNILLLSTTKKVKISGFGRSQRSDNDASSYKLVWTVPEILQMVSRKNPSQIQFTVASDIFSLGCVYFYVLSDGKNPFGDTVRHPACIIDEQFVMQTNDIIHGCSENIRFIQRMISSNPKERPTCNSLLSCPLFWTEDQKLRFLLDLLSGNWDEGNTSSKFTIECSKNCKLDVSSDRYWSCVIPHAFVMYKNIPRPLEKNNSQANYFQNHRLSRRNTAINMPKRETVDEHDQFDSEPEKWKGATVESRTRQCMEIDMMYKAESEDNRFLKNTFKPKNNSIEFGKSRERVSAVKIADYKVMTKKIERVAVLGTKRVSNIETENGKTINRIILGTNSITGVEPEAKKLENETVVKKGQEGAENVENERKLKVQREKMETLKEKWEKQVENEEIKLEIERVAKAKIESAIPIENLKLAKEERENERLESIKRENEKVASIKLENAKKLENEMQARVQRQKMEKIKHEWVINMEREIVEKDKQWLETIERKTAEKLEKKRMAKVQKEKVEKVANDWAEKVEREKIEKLNREIVAKTKKEKMEQAFKINKANTKALKQASDAKIEIREKDGVSNKKEKAKTLEKNWMAKVEREMTQTFNREEMPNVLERENIGMGAKINKEKAKTLERNWVAKVEQKKSNGESFPNVEIEDMEMTAKINKEKTKTLEKNWMAKVEREMTQKFNKEEMPNVLERGNIGMGAKKNKEKAKTLERNWVAQVEQKKSNGESFPNVEIEDVGMTAEIYKEKAKSLEKNWMAKVEREMTQKLSREEVSNVLEREEIEMGAQISRERIKTLENSWKAKVEQEMTEKLNKEIISKARREELIKIEKERLRREETERGIREEKERVRIENLERAIRENMERNIKNEMQREIRKDVEMEMREREKGLKKTQKFCKIT